MCKLFPSSDYLLLGLRPHSLDLGSSQSSGAGCPLAEILVTLTARRHFLSICCELGAALTQKENPEQGRLGLRPRADLGWRASLPCVGVEL